MLIKTIPNYHEFSYDRETDACSYIIHVGFLKVLHHTYKLGVETDMITGDGRTGVKVHDIII